MENYLGYPLLGKMPFVWNTFWQCFLIYQECDSYFGLMEPERLPEGKLLEYYERAALYALYIVN